MLPLSRVWFVGATLVERLFGFRQLCEERRGTRLFRPRLEALDERVTPTNWVVDITDDEDDGNYAVGDLSLREAVRLANANPGNDTITFAPALTSTLTLNDELTLSDTSGTTTITGPGADRLTISGGGTTRVFFVNPGVTASLSGLTVANGFGSFGGGIQNRGALTVTNSTISHNTGDFGGGMYSSGMLTVTDSTISHNTSGFGGGIYNVGAMTVTSSTISHNNASHGGGIFNDGTLTVTNSTLSGNIADGTGGGVVSLDDGPQSSTFTNVTITGNRADDRGGGMVTAGLLVTTVLVNTIVAGNFLGTAADDINGPVDTANSFNNLIGGGSGGLTNGTNNNRVGIDPTTVLSSTLADNGGLTLTHALLPDSPAINGGTNTPALTTDQRGQSRAAGGTADIGAFESLTVITDVSSSTANGPYGVGAVIFIDVTFNAPVTVTGTPQLTLETGATAAVAAYTAGSGSDTLTFTYTVAAGHTSPNLDYLSSTALALNGGTINDAGGIPTALTLPVPGAVGSLGANKNLVIETTVPALVITPNGITTMDNPIVFTFQFSEPVQNFVAGDVVVTGGTPGTFTALDGDTYTLTVTPVGPGTITAVVGAGTATDLAGNGNVASSASVTVPLPSLYAVGAGLGSVVLVFDARTGALVRGFEAFPGFAGGVTVASGDITGDGVPDQVVGTASGAAVVAVFDGVTGASYGAFVAFPGFTGGVNVATTDLNRDGYADVLVGAASVVPVAAAFDVHGGAVFGAAVVLPNSVGGVTVASGDITGDGVADLVFGSAGGPPRVVVFNGATGGQVMGLGFGGFTGGLRVAAGDLDGDGFAEVIVGAASTTSLIAVFDGRTATMRATFVGFPPDFGGGVRLGTVDANRDGRAELLAGVGPGAGPHVKRFDGSSLALLDGFDAFAPTFTGGVFVG
jgi:hypothetical protein